LIFNKKKMADRKDDSSEVKQTHRQQVARKNLEKAWESREKRKREAQANNPPARLAVPPPVMEPETEPVGVLTYDGDEYARFLESKSHKEEPMEVDYEAILDEYFESRIKKKQKTTATAKANATATSIVAVPSNFLDRVWQFTPDGKVILPLFLLLASNAIRFALASSKNRQSAVTPAIESSHMAQQQVTPQNPPMTQQFPKQTTAPQILNGNPYPYTL
jgi:hypothetical protein